MLILPIIEIFLLKIIEENSSFFFTLFHSYRTGDAAIPLIVVLFKIWLDVYYISLCSYIIFFVLASILALLIVYIFKNIIYKKYKIDSIEEKVSFLFIYFFTIFYASNFVYDKSEPIVYQTEIVDIWDVKGNKSGHKYYIKIAPWEYNDEIEEYTVSMEFYNKLYKGKHLKMYYKQGLFWMPWYYFKGDYWSLDVLENKFE